MAVAYFEVKEVVLRMLSLQLRFADWFRVWQLVGVGHRAWQLAEGVGQMTSEGVEHWLRKT